MASKKNYKTDEGVTRVEIGGYVHQNPGEAKVKMYVSDVNRPLEIEDADITKKLRKLAVEMRVVEDRTPYNNQVYDKTVTMEQFADNETGGRAGTTSTERVTLASPASPSAQPQDPFPSEPGNEHKTRTLKNFIDELSANARADRILIAAALVLGAVAVGIALL